MRRAPARAAFTLIEMMAVVLFTGIVLTAAVNFYLDVATASTAATERTREGRRAVALLDRIARDFEGTMLIKTPEGVDPIENPWIFLAESRGTGLGAERVKFVSLARTPRADAAHESDLEMVAYELVPHEDEDGAFDLLRWTSPRLPEARDVTFPAPDDPGTLVLAERIGGFGLRFLAEDGTWTETWDSSQISEASELPLMVEIQLVPLAPEVDGLAPDDGEAPNWVRQVLLPVRPLDDADLFGAEAAGGDEDQGAEDQGGDGAAQSGAGNPAAGGQPAPSPGAPAPGAPAPGAPTPEAP